MPEQTEETRTIESLIQTNGSLRVEIERLRAELKKATATISELKAILSKPQVSHF